MTTEKINVNNLLSRYFWKSSDTKNKSKKYLKNGCRNSFAKSFGT